MGAPVQITMDCAALHDWSAHPPSESRRRGGVAGRWPGAVARITVTTGA